MCSALSGSCEVHGASYSGVKRPSVPGQLQDKGANEAVRAKKKYTVFRGFVVLQLFSHVQLFETPWTAAYQASPSFTVSQRFTQVPVKQSSSDGKLGPHFNCVFTCRCANTCGSRPRVQMEIHPLDVSILKA